MKKLLFFLLLIVFYSEAQTGIGTTTPNASAKLDIFADNKGFLPPRVALTATNVFAPVTGLSGSTALATAAGLLVYNTTSNGNVLPGYYYWNGTLWVQISNGLIVDSSNNTSFSVAASDNNKLFLINSSTAVTVTVPTGLPSGFACQFIQIGAGAIILRGGSGVTLNSASGFTTRVSNSAVGLVMSSSASGFVFGDTIN
ncbi:MAG: hypothetical protein RLZZ252_414 [Bacteroidota bacterium]|jgi:hypothetical protein